MKKLFAILAAAMMVVCASSCNKVAKSLAGTEWSITMNEGDLVITGTLAFFKGGLVNLSESANGTSMTISGTYSYTYPNVSCTLDFGGEVETVTGTVSADYKTMSLAADGEDAIVFTRSK